MELLFRLLVAHALGDFAFQSDWIARNKNRYTSDFPETIWPYALFIHCLIQGGMVYWATNNVYLGIAETVAHAVIDIAKCEKLFGFHVDQFLHILCKVIWAVLMLRAGLV